MRVVQPVKPSGTLCLRHAASSPALLPASRKPQVPRQVRFGTGKAPVPPEIGLYLPGFFKAHEAKTLNSLYQRVAQKTGNFQTYPFYLVARCRMTQNGPTVPGDSLNLLTPDVYLREINADPALKGLYRRSKQILAKGLERMVKAVYTQKTGTFPALPEFYLQGIMVSQPLNWQTPRREVGFHRDDIAGYEIHRKFTGQVLLPTHTAVTVISDPNEYIGGSWLTRPVPGAPDEAPPVARWPKHRQGDLIVIDNHRFQHGAEPYERNLTYSPDPDYPYRRTIMALRILPVT